MDDPALDDNLGHDSAMGDYVTCWPERHRAMDASMHRPSAWNVRDDWRGLNTACCCLTLDRLRFDL